LILFSGACFAADTCLKYDDPTVSLKGKVVLRTFFGPPNYGENPRTDSKEQQGILILGHPICVEASQEEKAEVAQKEITLIPLGNFGLYRYVGKRVTVAGRLFHAISGHHHTMVIIELRQPPTMLH